MNKTKNLFLKKIQYNSWRKTQCDVVKKQCVVVFFYSDKRFFLFFICYLFGESSEIRHFSLAGWRQHEAVSTFGYLALWQVFNTHTAR